MVDSAYTSIMNVCKRPAEERLPAGLFFQPPVFRLEHRGIFLLFLQFLKPAGKFFFPSFMFFKVRGVDQFFGLFAGRNGFFDCVIAAEMILLALEIDICTPSTVAVFAHTIRARSGIFIDMASDRPCANRHKGRATRVSCAVNCPGFLSNVPVAICAMLDSRKPCDLYGGFLPTFRANSTAQKAA